ncbi:30S ribosome-binding factor RbfA [Flavobacteriaceae bacterium]|nr:30S ribosome-binding factor RbfA [Flavobacteriaceae bacterium]
MSVIKSQKQLQVGENIKRIIADIFLYDDLFSFKKINITVKRVDISPDMKNAKVFLAIFGEIEPSVFIESINNSSNYFQKKLLNKLHLRVLPKILFILDKNYENSFKINKILESESPNFLEEK